MIEKLRKAETIYNPDDILLMKNMVDLKIKILEVTEGRFSEILANEVLPLAI